MQFLKKRGYYFLLLAVASDFLTPYGLGLFYPKLNQMTAVMSVFGDVDSPVRTAFLVWSVISGIFYVLAVPAIYETFRHISRSLALLPALSIALYGIGDCIFTGLFSIDTLESTWNLSTWIHNIGSGLGYAGFYIFPFSLFLLYRKSGNAKESHLYLILLGMIIFFGAIYGFARFPAIDHLPVFNQLGFTQRLSFFFNYWPIVILAVRQVKRTK